MPRTVLFVDDAEDTADLLATCMARRGYTALATCTAREALALLETRAIDVVVTDVAMPGMSGIDLCAMLREHYPEIVVLVVTGRTTVPGAIEALHAGAHDYIVKPVTLDVLEIALARAFEYLELRRELQRLRTTIHPELGAGVVGNSVAVCEMLDLVRRVAASDATVLISGETGTGKELVARALHDLSSRRERPFVAINCGAMPAGLLESELFGHVLGAFTDASRANPGLFVRAGAGTIFLDELGEMPLQMQSKLLRALQERTVRPVGGDVELPFAARVIASTNRDLELEIAEKRFREDLFYRIDVVRIDVPPLRARGADVLVLAQHFLRRAATRTGKPVHAITAGAAKLLARYDWPGNIRELENCMERAVALCRFDQIMVDDLPAKLHEHREGSFVVPCLAPTELLTLQELERRYVQQVVTAWNGNKTRAARTLGIDRRSVHRRLARPSTG